MLPLPTGQLIHHGGSPSSPHHHDHSSQPQDLPLSPSTSPEQTPSPPHPTSLRIICICHPPPSAKEATFKQCQTCGHLQHTACTIHDIPDQAPEENTCNECKIRSFKRHLHLQRQQQAALLNLVERKRKIVHTFYHEMLWKQYCELPLHNPMGRGLYRLRELTKMRVGRDGYKFCVNAAPLSWVNEMQKKVFRMMEDAGREEVVRFMGERSAWEAVDLKLLVQWQNLAIWMLQDGPYQGRQTDRMGVLAELLGFEEKGTFWKGEEV